MTIDSNDLILFAQVVEYGSFNRAAHHVGLPNSTVSRRIAMLESQLGEQLLLRTTRRLTLTDFGASMLEHARQVAAEMEAAEAMVQHRRDEPGGRLRVSMPNELATGILAPMLAAFVARYPAVSLQLDLTPRIVDLVGENVDIAIRMGDKLEDSSLSARRLAQMAGGLYASPIYLAQRGVPETPEALKEHDALCLLSRYGKPIGWTLTSGAARWDGMPRPRAAVNSQDVLINLACAGTGIGLFSDAMAHPHVRQGALVPVLPAWTGPPTAAWAVFHGRRLMGSRTKVFLEALEAVFSAERCGAVQEQITQDLVKWRSATPA